ncbi:MAG: hypothetical protein ACK4PH_06740, partial [Aquincola tertiaricarbonis]
ATPTGGAGAAGRAARAPVAERPQAQATLPASGPASTEELLLKPVNHFAAEMDYFAACALANQPPRTDGEMGLADVRIIDAIEQSLREGGVVRLQA